MSRSFLLVAFIVSFVSCSDEVNPPPSNDSGIDQLQIGDGAQFDGAITTTCNDSLNLSPHTLSSNYCVVHKFDFEDVGYNLNGNTVWKFGIVSGKKYDFEIVEYNIDAQTEKLVNPTNFFSFSVEEETTEDVLADKFIARSSNGLLAVSYNTVNFQNPKGAVYWGSKGSTPSRFGDVNGAYSGVYINETILLLNVSGGVDVAQSGPGIYVVKTDEDPWRLIKNLGDTSGHVTMGNNALVAGSYSFSKSSNVFYGFSKAEIQTAISNKTELDAATAGDELITGNILAATSWENDLVIIHANDEFKFSTMDVYSLQVTNDSVGVLDGSETVITAGEKNGINNVVADGERLAVLNVNEDTNQATLAIIKKK